MMSTEQPDSKVVKGHPNAIGTKSIAPNSPDPLPPIQTEILHPSVELGINQELAVGVDDAGGGDDDGGIVTATSADVNNQSLETLPAEHDDVGNCNTDDVEQSLQNRDGNNNNANDNVVDVEGTYDYSSTDSEYSEPPEALILSSLDEFHDTSHDDDESAPSNVDYDVDAIWIAAILVERVSVHDPIHSNWALKRVVLLELENMGLDVSVDGLSHELEKAFSTKEHVHEGKVYIAYVDFSLLLKDVITSTYSSRDQMDENTAWVYIQWGSQSGWFNLITGQAWDSSVRDIGDGLTTIYDASQNEKVMEETKALNRRVGESQLELERVLAEQLKIKDKFEMYNTSRPQNALRLTDLQGQLEKTRYDSSLLHAQLEQHMQQIEQNSTQEQPGIVLTRACDEVSSQLAQARKKLTQLQSERKINARKHESELSHNQLFQLERSAQLGFLREEEATLRSENGVLGWQVSEASLDLIELSPYTAMNQKLEEQTEATKQTMRNQKRQLQTDVKEILSLHKENEECCVILGIDTGCEVDLDGLETHLASQKSAFVQLQLQLEATKTCMIQAEIKKKALQKQRDVLGASGAVAEIAMQRKVQAIREFDSRLSRTI